MHAFLCQGDRQRYVEAEDDLNVRDEHNNNNTGHHIQHSPSVQVVAFTRVCM